MQQRPLSAILALLASALVASVAAAAGAVAYGTLQNAPDAVAFVAYRNQANPQQILTQDNLGGGYASPFWQLDTSNFAPEHEAGAPLRVVFSDPASPTRFWERDFANPETTTNLGQVPEGSPVSDGACPAPALAVFATADDQRVLSWVAPDGVSVSLYHTNTGSEPAGNGRYDLLQASATPPYSHTVPAGSQNWYVLTTLDDGQRPLGCTSIGQSRQARYDFDYDCHVDSLDVAAAAGSWGCSLGDDCYVARHDVDGSEAVAIDDIMQVAGRWGCRCDDACYD